MLVDVEVFFWLVDKLVVVCKLSVEILVECVVELFVLFDLWVGE